MIRKNSGAVLVSSSSPTTAMKGYPPEVSNICGAIIEVVTDDYSYRFVDKYMNEIDPKQLLGRKLKVID
jgi:hypothetical protein